MKQFPSSLVLAWRRIASNHSRAANDPLVFTIMEKALNRAFSDRSFAALNRMV